MLQLAITYLQSFDYVEVIYGDVDSVMIRLPSTWLPERCVKEATDLVIGLNKMLWHKFQGNGLSEERVQLLRIKLEAFYVTYLLVDVKKRYSGIRVWQDGKGFTPPTFHSVGHELNRSDRCLFVRQLQKQLLQMIHKQVPIETIIQFLKQAKTDLFAGKYDKDLVIAVRLAKPLSRYKKPYAPARAAKILRRMGRYLPYLKVKYVYLSHSQVWPVGRRVRAKRITREGHEHIWKNRSMTWIPKLLQPFIAPSQLCMELEGVRSLDHFIVNRKSTGIPTS